MRRRGVVLVDTQFLPSDALKFADQATAATGKPVKLAVVLHPNPDKFNGTAALQARAASTSSRAGRWPN